jgi:hypothetical protein
MTCWLVIAKAPNPVDEAWPVALPLEPAWKWMPLAKAAGERITDTAKAVKVTMRFITSYPLVSSRI